MANLEITKNSNVFQFDLPAMAAGVQTFVGATNNVLSTNFFLGTSKILGLVRKTAGGVVGNPYIDTIGSSGAVGSKVINVTLKSSVNTDISVYTLLWVNEVGSSALGLMNA